VNGWHNRNRLFGGVNVGELVADFENRWQALVDHIRTQMVEFEVNVGTVWSATTTFLDFLIHTSRNKVAWCQILQGRRITLHEALAVLVEQDTALATHAFGNQHACTRDTCRMELPKLHVHHGNASTSGHTHSVTGINEGISRCGPDTSGTTCGDHGCFSFENVNLARFHLKRRHAQDITCVVTDQIKRHPFNEELRARGHVALIQRVQQSVTCTVSGSTGALHRLFAKVGRVTTERALIDRPVRVAIKRHTHVLKLIDRIGRFATHEFDSILIAQPIRPLDGVVHVPVPIVFAHIAERGANATLRSDSVRACRKDF